MSVATAVMARVGGRRAARLLALPLELPLVIGGALIGPVYFLNSVADFALPFDDSYISLQYARNLADHAILSFDGETVSAGATSLLHVSLLAGLLKLGADPEPGSAGLGIALQVGLVGALYWLGWAIFRDRVIATASGASGAVAGYLQFDALNGMETTLFLLLNTAAVASLFTFRNIYGATLTGVLLALGCLTRPEGLFLTGAVGLYAALTLDDAGPLASWRAAGERRHVLRLVALIAPSVAALAGLAIFYRLETGDFTPATANAKLVFFHEYSLSLSRRVDWATGGITRFAGPLLPWLAASAFAIRRREVVPFAAYWLIFVVVYALLFPGGLYHYWYRYQHAFIPPLLVFGSAGAVLAARLVLRDRRWLPAVAGGGAVLALMLWAQFVEFRHNYELDVGLNVNRHEQAALYARAIVPEGASIAVHDIGVIGYRDNGRHELIDLVGLINPDVIDYHHDRSLTAYVAEQKPDYLLVLDGWDRDYLKLGVLDPTRYELLGSFPGNALDDKKMLLLRYRAAP